MQDESVKPRFAHYMICEKISVVISSICQVRKQNRNRSDNTRKKRSEEKG